MAGVPGSLFGCSDAGDAGWLRIILQTGLSGCSTQYFLASAMGLATGVGLVTGSVFTGLSPILQSSESG